MNKLYQITAAGDHQRPAIIQLLREEKLPVDDLPLSLNNFFVARDHEQVIGAIGLERYGDNGLLRSMVVSRAYRNNNIASQLVLKLESFAQVSGIDFLYLLTETAPLFFERKGYQKITRDDVPVQLKTSSEFSHVCPSGAIVMKKQMSFNKKISR